MNKCVRNNCRKYFKKANYKEEVTKGGNHAQFGSYGKQSGHKVDSLRSSDKICFTVYGNEMAGKAAQLFEIEIEHMSGKEVQER